MKYQRIVRKLTLPIALMLALVHALAPAVACTLAFAPFHSHSHLYICTYASMDLRTRLVLMMGLELVPVKVFLMLGRQYALLAK